MKNRKLVAVTGLMVAVIMMASTLIGCAGGGATTPQATTQPGTTPAAPATTAAPAPSGKTIEIRFLDPTTAGSLSYDPENKLIDDFNKANPGVKVVHDAQPSAELRTKLTVEFAAGNPPEISWSPLSYAYEFMRDNKIVDWKPIFDDPKNPEFKQWFSAPVLQNSANLQGKITMCPYEALIEGLYYNKEIFQKYGWQPPKTFDELLDLSKKAKEKGITALVTGGKDMRFSWLASAILVKTAGVKNAQALAIGDAQTKWSDPNYGFVEAMTKFKQLVDAGAYPAGVLGLSANEADQMFVRGEAAMYYEGQWKPGNFKTAGGDAFMAKLGRVPFPAITGAKGDQNIPVGGIITGIIMASGMDAAKQEMALKFVKAYVGPDYQIPKMERGDGLYAGNAQYDKSKMSDITNTLIDAFRTAPGYIPSMDAFAPPAVDLAIKKTAMPGIITKEFDVDKAVAAVQKAAEEYAASVKK